MYSRQLLIIILVAIALTVIGPSLIQQARAVGNSSSLGKENPTQVPLGFHHAGIKPTVQPVTTTPTVQPETAATS